jgi:hypothetical protein
MKKVSAVKARHGLGDLLNRVSLKKESFVIERAGMEMAVLGPCSSARGDSSADPSGVDSLRDADRAGKLDIRDLAGIGADLWSGEDAAAYIRRERDAWE